MNGELDGEWKERWLRDEWRVEGEMAEEKDGGWKEMDGEINGKMDER